MSRYSEMSPEERNEWNDYRREAALDREDLTELLADESRDDLRDALLDIMSGETL